MKRTITKENGMKSDTRIVGAEMQATKFVKMAETQLAKAVNDAKFNGAVFTNIDLRRKHPAQGQSVDRLEIDEFEIGLVALLKATGHWSRAREPVLKQAVSQIFDGVLADRRCQRVKLKP